MTSPLDEKAEHPRIWLEPAGAPDRCWCEDNQWGDEGVEYVRATTAETQLAALTKRVGELEGALEFYRDGFEFHTNPRRAGLEWKPTETLLDDCGNTARLALARRLTGGEANND